MGRKHKKTKKRSTAPKVQAKTSKPNLKWLYWSLAIIAVVWLISYSMRGSDYPAMITPKVDRGAEDATILIEEWSDLQCPACRQAHPGMQKILEDYDGQVKWRFYHYPLSYHRYADTAAVGAECANDQGIFWEYVDIVYENQARMSKSELIQYATELGADETFKSCINSNTKDHIIKADMAEGNNRKVSGTPSFFVNGKPVNGIDYNAISRAVEAELK